jgi:hypothetical protein
MKKQSFVKNEQSSKEQATPVKTHEKKKKINKKKEKVYFNPNAL